MVTTQANIFQMRAKPHGVDRLQEFLSEGYLAIGWPGVGSLQGVDKDEIRIRLDKKYGYEGQSLATNLGTVNAFVNTMTEGDVVLVAEGDYVHIGIVGPYSYEEDYEEEGTCHRRSCTWKCTVKKHYLNAEVLELLRHRTSVTKFKHPFQVADIEQYLDGSFEFITLIPEKGEHSELANKALNILVGYLNDEQHKLTAAIEILRFLK